jgi:hypothetical protein
LVSHLTGRIQNDCVAEYVESNSWPQENLKEDGENYTLENFALVTKCNSRDQVRRVGLAEYTGRVGVEMKFIHNVSKESGWSCQWRYVHVSRRIMLKCILRKCQGVD